MTKLEKNEFTENREKQCGQDTNDKKRGGRVPNQCDLPETEYVIAFGVEWHIGRYFGTLIIWFSAKLFALKIRSVFKAFAETKVNHSNLDLVDIEMDNLFPVDFMQMNWDVVDEEVFQR